ncbi:MAG: peroxiredoxin family protein [Armatimonadota bacterium]
MKTRRSRWLWFAAVAVLAAASLVCADLSTGKKAPDFSLPTIDGKTFKLSSCFAGRGKVVLLDIWATRCPPCRAEIPFLIGLRKKFNEKDVVIAGVSIDAEKSTVVDFAKKQGINYIVAHDPRAAKIGDLYQVRGIPATYVIDRKGIIRYAHLGFPGNINAGKEEAAKLEREIRTLLAEK